MLSTNIEPNKEKNRKKKLKRIYITREMKDMENRTKKKKKKKRGKEVNIHT